MGLICAAGRFHIKQDYYLLVAAGKMLEVI